ncbi:MAG: hypothetical protein H6732_11280, partial [Alphaproteobacteria bacterium]|nr:hypothetical protein [Alphaproteobacteria bacterium]
MSMVLTTLGLPPGPSIVHEMFGLTPPRADPPDLPGDEGKAGPHFGTTEERDLLALLRRLRDLPAFRVVEAQAFPSVRAHGRDTGVFDRDPAGTLEEARIVLAWVVWAEEQYARKLAWAKRHAPRSAFSYEVKVPPGSP